MLFRAQIIILFLLLGISRSAANAQVSISTSLGSFVLGHHSLEVSAHLKGRMNFGARVAAIGPLLENNQIATGYFFKAGPKIYWQMENAKQMQGLFLSPQIAYGRWTDWETGAYILPGDRWETSWGVFANLGYGWSPVSNIIVEPWAGIGFAQTLESQNIQNDQPPFDPFEVRGNLLERQDIEGGVHSFLPITNSIAVNAGIQIGFIF